ncbi:response regulator [Nannocystis pusilla]|uniref:response regulator n=1 Tax=Nannocystis pusilla TaxID=889268 RepID=UPI003DA6955C
MRILFVEDHLEFARTVTVQFLAEHDVTLAASVSEAKVRLAAERYDVLLVDHDLPDGRGPEVVEYARARGILSDVIAVSSHEAGNEALERAGALARCPKGRFHEIGAVLTALRR